MAGKITSTTNKKQEDLARFCALIGNPTRIAILEKVACGDSCEGNIKEVAGLSKFTVGMNLKYLKKYGLVKGTFTSKNISYCLDYERLEEFKNLFDLFYGKVTKNKEKNTPCTSGKK